MTHDSIGLGEDGPTHQPVEHLASLRAIPGPAGVPARPTRPRRWNAGRRRSRSARRPSVLALTRQNLPPCRKPMSRTISRPKAPMKSPASAAAKVSMFASGSEVEIALPAATVLEGEGIAARVVSVPCFELFLRPGDGRRASHRRRRRCESRSRRASRGLGRFPRRERRFHRHDRLRRLRPLEGRLDTSALPRMPPSTRAARNGLKGL